MVVYSPYLVSYYSFSWDKEMPCLTIRTDKITNEIIESIADNVICVDFIATKWNKIEFDVDMDVWTKFAERLTYLTFNGALRDNKFTAKHVECLKSIQSLTIGGTNYPLFDNEDITNLPIIKELIYNGYGTVIPSDNFVKWLDVLKENKSFILYRQCGKNSS